MPGPLVAQAWQRPLDTGTAVLAFMGPLAPVGTEEQIAADASMSSSVRNAPAQLEALPLRSGCARRDGDEMPVRMEFNDHGELRRRE